MNRRITWLSHALLPAALAALAGGCGRGGAAGALADGVEAFQKGQYERAQSRLERAIKLAGDVKEMSPAYNLLGMARYRLKDLESARTAFEESRRLDHAYAPAAYNLGLLNAEQDRMPDAAAQLQDAHRLLGGDARPLELLSGEYRRKGMWREAQREILAAGSSRPRSARILTATAASVLETEGAASALAYLQAALKYEPDYPPALFNTGLVHSQWLKDRDGALKAFSRYLEIVKDPPANLRTIAENEVARIRKEIDHEFANRGGRPANSPPAAEPTANPLRPDNTPPPVAAGDEVARLLDSARAAVAARKFDDALNLCLYAAGMASRANDPAREEKAYRAAVAFCPDQPRAHFALAGFLAEAGRHKDAMAAFRKAAELDPKWSKAHRLAAASAIELGEYQGALESLKKAVEIDPQNADATWALAQVYDQHIKLPESARRTYEKFATAFPNDPRAADARKALQRIERAASRSTSPSTPVRSAPVVTPEAPPASPAAPVPTPSNVRTLTPAMRAGPTVLTPRSDNPPAATTLMPAASPPPRPAATPARAADVAAAMKEYDQGVALQKKGDLDAAVTHYQESIRLHSQDPRAYYNLGIIYQNRKQYDLARNSYAYALELNPGMINARYNLGLVYRDLRRIDDAVRELNRVIQDSPTNASAHLLLGEIYDAAGERIELARDHYERFLELAPEDPSAPMVRRWLIQH